jgi:hypothetical protein
MNSGSNNNNEKGVEVRTHDIPVADAMSEFMKQGWAGKSCFQKLLKNLKYVAYHDKSSSVLYLRGILFNAKIFR